MKTYNVTFTWSGSVFTEHQIVYYVDNRQQAIKAVKDHYGKSVKIISAKEMK